MTSRLEKMPGLRFSPVEGAFYVLFDMSSYVGQTLKGFLIQSDVDFCSYMLEHAHVAMVPGSSFECPNSVRISYATSLDILKEAMDRLEEALIS